MERFGNWTFGVFSVALIATITLISVWFEFGYGPTMIGIALLLRGYSSVYAKAITERLRF